MRILNALATVVVLTLWSFPALVHFIRDASARRSLRYPHGPGVSRPSCRKNGHCELPMKQSFTPTDENGYFNSRQKTFSNVSNRGGWACPSK